MNQLESAMRMIMQSAKTREELKQKSKDLVSNIEYQRKQQLYKLRL